MEKILRFGYGTNRTQAMLNWITGKTNFRGKPATIEGWKLAMQKLPQGPKVIVPTCAGSTSLLKHLRTEWEGK